MLCRLNLLLSILSFSLGAILAGVTGAATREELPVQEEPGYVPTPEEAMLPAEYRPQPVYFRTNEAPGTIIIQSDERFLYLVQPGGMAIRYGVGVGRDGFRWEGLLKISRKQEWPDWRPPPTTPAAPPPPTSAARRSRSTTAGPLSPAGASTS